ncbi:MAG: zinc ribbon domain-containing protein [Nodosilinea sp.]
MWFNVAQFSRQNRPKTTPRSKHCFACGSELQDSCSGCHKPIDSLKFRFCLYCGKSYKGVNS